MMRIRYSLPLNVDISNHQIKFKQDITVNSTAGKINKKCQYKLIAVSRYFLKLFIANIHSNNLDVWINPVDVLV